MKKTIGFLCTKLLAICILVVFAVVFILSMDPKLMSAEGEETNNNSQAHRTSVNVDEKYISLIEDNAKKILYTWRYPGGELPESEMYFYDNGLMALDSYIFTKGERTYFLWAFNEGKGVIKLIFIDRRVNYKKMVIAEKDNDWCAGYNENEKSISYKILKKYNGIYFAGWLFAE